MTWGSALTGRAPQANNRVVSETCNVKFNQLVSFKENKSCVDRLYLDNRSVNKGVNWGHSCGPSCNHVQYNKGLLCHNKLMCNLNVESHSVCAEGKINVSDHRKLVVSKNLEHIGEYSQMLIESC